LNPRTISGVEERSSRSLRNVVELLRGGVKAVNRRAEDEVGSKKGKVVTFNFLDSDVKSERGAQVLLALRDR